MLHTVLAGATEEHIILLRAGVTNHTAALALVVYDVRVIRVG